MKVSVWDTYVKREDGAQMHFDILVPSNLQDETTIFEYGSDYLKTKPFKTSVLSANECKFCHIEQASEAMTGSISSQGYFIIEMENCD